ncbi:unnamed protein product, partial [Scytosiphon promiscuus]
MKRSKILIGISLLILTIVTLVLNAFMSAPDPGSEVAVTSIDHLKDALTAKEELLYKRHQEELEVAINAYFDKAISAGDIVGAGVSIVKDDSIILSDGYGKRNINRDDRVDGGTIFRLGSLSKGFAGVLAAELKDEGKLHWEDKVSDFIPEFKFGDSN